MDGDRTRIALRRVAEALGVSEDTFLARRDDTRSSPEISPAEEQLELLRLFATITDPEVRRSCLEYVRNAAVPTDMAAG